MAGDLVSEHAGMCWMEVRDCKCPGSSCILSLLIVDLENDSPTGSLVVGSSTVCEASVHAAVLFPVNSGHLLVLQLPWWTLVSQVQKYVLLLADHFTRTPLRRPSLCIYTRPSTRWSGYLGGCSKARSGCCTGVVVVVKTGVALGSPDISISMLDYD